MLGAVLDQQNQLCSTLNSTALAQAILLASVPDHFVHQTTNKKEHDYIFMHNTNFFIINIVILSF